MTKRSLLAVAIATLGIQSVQAAPFLPMDARGLAMGNTGVASAKRAHAPAYNPSLLSQASEDDDFALLFPQVGVAAADEEGLVDEAQTISDDIFPAFERAIDGGDGLQSFENRINQLNDAISTLDNAIATANDPNDLSAVITANQGVINALGNTQSNINLLQSSTSELTSSLQKVSGNPLMAKLGVGGALAIPSKTFAAAISIQGSANISARANFSNDDLSLLNAYPGAAKEYVDDALGATSQLQTDLQAVQNETNPIEKQNKLNTAKASAAATIDALNDFDKSYTKEDGSTVNIFTNGSFVGDSPDMSSTVQVVAVSVIDAALSFSREFDIVGEKVAIGITPKLQKVSTFHYADEVDGFEDVESDDIEDSREDYSKVNLDIGASYRFGSEGNWVAGVVGKNLLGGEFDYADVVVTPKDSDGNPNGLPYTLDGGSVSLNPQFRAGIAYQSSWVNVALDVDLTENDPIAFESATQYAAIGAEFDLFSTLQLRAGYRTNMSTTNADMVSVGLGLSPFGIHLDIAAMANPSDPEKEAGVALETGFYF